MTMLAIDWGYALLVTGMGIGTVFLLLIVLIWVIVVQTKPGDMNGSFYIQIAALSSQASAQDLVRRLQNRNLGGRAFYAPSLGLWRVQAGPFNSLNRAEDLSDELNRQYPGNFVVAD